MINLLCTLHDTHVHDTRALVKIVLNLHVPCTYCCNGELEILIILLVL